MIGCKGELLLYSSGDYVTVATSYSNSQGLLEYYLSPENVSDRWNHNYKIRLFPGDDNLVVTTNVHFETSSNSTQSNTYWAKEYSTLFPCVDTPCYNIKFGSTYKCSDIEVNINSSDPYSDGFGMCFYIGQAGLRAKEFATEMMGYSPKIVALDYDRYADGSYYNGAIHIACNAWSSKFDSVMHEYGHHLQEELKNARSITFGSHDPGKPVNKAFAWSEAWPTVFAKVAQNYAPVSKRPTFTLKYDFGGFVYGKDSSTGYDLGSNNHNSEYLENFENGRFVGKGEEIEEVIEEILWDIFDYKEDGEEDFDQVNFGYEYWFFITTRENTFTIKNLYDNLIHYYPQFESQVKDLFAYHGITY